MTLETMSQLHYTSTGSGDTTPCVTQADMTLETMSQLHYTATGSGDTTPCVTQAI